MELKKILAALLPFESREHVLGDLEERGFRFGDVVNVLPRVWWSHWVREWNGHSFVTAKTSDAALRHRARQFARRRNVFQAVIWAFAVVAGSDGIHRMIPQHRHSSTEPVLSFLVCVVIGFLFRSVVEKTIVPPVNDRHLWLVRHQHQLTNALWGGCLRFEAAPFPIRFLVRFLWVSVYVAWVAMLWWPGPTVLILELVLVALWEYRRQRRIQAELEHLSALIEL